MTMSEYVVYFIPCDFWYSGSFYLNIPKSEMKTCLGPASCRPLVLIYFSVGKISSSLILNDSTELLCNLYVQWCLKVCKPFRMFFISA